MVRWARHLFRPEHPMSDPDAPLETIPASKKAHRYFIAWAGTSMLAAGVEVFRGQPPLAVIWTLTSFMAIATLIWSYRTSIVRVYEDGMEIKLGPLAPVKSAGFGQIATVRETKRSILVKLRPGQGKQEIKIPRYFLEKDDQKWLVEKLKFEIAAA